MSASREKKKRQEFFAGGGVDPKAARAAEQKAAERKANILYATLAVVFVVVAVLLVVYNSGIIQRGRTAVTIDGENYTAADVSYYYSNAYQNVLNTYGSYASLIGLDTTASLKDQYAWGGTEQTWDEYFKEEAVNTLRLVHAALDAAAEEGMTLDEEDQAELENNIQQMQETAASNGYSYSAYLNAIYGSVMTTEVYEGLVEDNLLANKYLTAHHDSISFTDEEIEAYYEENKNSYDIVDGGYVSFYGAATSTTDEEGNTVEPTEEEDQAAMDEAMANAEALLAAYQEGGDLEALAEEYGGTYTGGTDLTYSSGTTGDWLFDEARTAGDAEILTSDSSDYVYVAVFNSRQRDEALDYNVRHILVTDANLDLAEGEDATDEMVLARAEEILDSWDGTEDGFAALAEEYSQDGGSNTNGGLYENVAKGTMVSAFEDWCYEDGRQAGDTGIVESSYGQHIMYFVGYGTTEYWHYACENAMISNEYSEWQTSLMDSVTAETAGGMDYVGF